MPTPPRSARFDLGEALGIEPNLADEALRTLICDGLIGATAQAVSNHRPTLRGGSATLSSRRGSRLGEAALEAAAVLR